jgi:hypothetical protein
MAFSAAPGPRTAAGPLSSVDCKNRLAVTDGPFTETKEVVGDYALCEFASKEEALKMAREFMELHRVYWPAFEGECEVRPLEDM